MGTRVVPYREYASGTLCSAGAAYQPTLQGELEGMNVFLSDFLQGTSAAPDGALTQESIDVLAGAEKSLTPALTAYEKTLQAASQCIGFDRKYQFPDLIKKGQELSRQARQRIAGSAGLLPVLQAKLQLQQWKQQQRAEQETERASWCPPKPRGVPDVYFALEDENGRVEWLFCDGATVVDGPDHPPEFVAPKDGKPVPRAGQAVYLRAASKYPESQIRRAPRLPSAASGGG